MMLEELTPAYGLQAVLVREHLEEWCLTRLEWVHSEPHNDAGLWAQIVSDLNGHLCVMWASRVLQGGTRKESYFVQCDRTTMTQTDIDNGTLICHIGVAPEKPGEFVIFRLRMQLRGPFARSGETTTLTGHPK